MKTLATFLLILSLLVTLSAIAADAPAKIEFESKMGKVTFDHKAHAERAKEDCTVCHDKLFPPIARAHQLQSRNAQACRGR